MENAETTLSLEHLPGDIFTQYIFKYLSPGDIFKLGRCSKTLRNIVIENAFHPLSTSLQCIKTTYNHYYKKSTVYDVINRFKCIDKCGTKSCKCNNFRQFKDWIILDPSLCGTCKEYLYNVWYYCTDSFLEPCNRHCTLLRELLELNLCKDCYVNHSHYGVNILKLYSYLQRRYCLSCKDLIEFRMSMTKSME